MCFNDRSPDDARVIGVVSGLAGADATLIGIDFRVQDGKLYGVGSGGGVYTLDLRTAAATPAGQLTATLTDTFYGVDFNPAADRLRVVGDAGQNLRHNVNAGGTTIVDTMLNYMPGVAATGITGAAYVNNDLDPNTATALFDVDTTLNQVALQSPPNNGSLAATGKLTVDPGSAVGFDVFSAVVGGTTVGNHAFASLVVGGVTGFYRVDLLTGKATFVEAFTLPVVDVAIPLATTTP
jgi:hypothetical protein